MWVNGELLVRFGGGLWDEISDAGEIFLPAKRIVLTSQDKNFQVFGDTPCTFRILEVSCFRVLLTDNYVVVTIKRSMEVIMNRVLIFIAGGIAGYIASGWLKGFMEEVKEEE